MAQELFSVDKMIEENRMFIGGLAQATTNESLLGYFMQYGAIDANVMMDKETGRSKGFGFVLFASTEGVQLALQTSHSIDGKPVDCQLCLAKGSNPPPKNPPHIIPPTLSIAQPLLMTDASVGSTVPTNFAKVPPSGAAPTQNKVFVGGLSQASTKESMEAYFSQFGPVECKVMMDKETGRSRGFGFAIFDSPFGVRAVLRGVTWGSQSHIIDDKTVECKACEEAVQTSMPPPAMQPAVISPVMPAPMAAPTAPRVVAPPAQAAASLSFESLRIFVGGLPQTCDNDKLSIFFSQFGTIVEAKVHYDLATGRSKGFGYVNFDSPEAVEMAIVNGPNNIIDEKWVDVKRCETRTKSGGTGSIVGPIVTPQAVDAYSMDAATMAVDALSSLSCEQAGQIAQVVQLLQDPSTAHVITSMLDQVTAGGGAKARSVRPSPY